MTDILRVLGIEDLPQRRRDHVAPACLAVAVHVPYEVDRATLPRAAQHLGDRRLQAEVVVGDGQPHALEAPGPQLAQEGGPTGRGLRLGDLDADHLPAPGPVHREGDHQRLRVDVAPVSDLQVLGIQPEIRELSLQGPGTEGLDLVVELAADP